MAKARIKPEDLLGGRNDVALLPGSPTSPFLDPAVAQAAPQGSELYSLGTVQQAAASQSPENEMFMPSVLQPSQAYPTGTEGSPQRPVGASPMLYPSAQETQPKLKTRLKPDEALALAEVNRPKRKSPDQIVDEMAVSMYDASRDPLPMDLWEKAGERRSQMVQGGRLPMEFGEIDSLMGGLVWGKDAAYGMVSYLANTTAGLASSIMSQPVESVRQLSATIPSAVQRTATEFGLQTYQDVFNLTHEPMYRVKETGEFVAVNKTGLPLVMPQASGGNRVISGDGLISPVAPEQGIREFAKRGMTLVPVNDQDRKEYRYGQYLDRMGIMSESMKAQNLKAPPEFVTAVLTQRWDAVEPNQAQAEVALMAAQSVVPMGAASRTWGVSRRFAGGLSRAAETLENIAGLPVDVDTALRAKFVSAMTRGTGAEAAAQKTAMQAAIEASKTTAKVGGAYAAAAGVSAFEGTPSEIKDLAWTAANLYSGYKGGMYVARQLQAASGFTKTVLKEVADPSRGLDAGARAAVVANPAVPQSVREVLERPSLYRATESTPARLAQNPELSPTSRAVFDKLSDYRAVQAARLAKATAAGVPKGIIANVPFAAGAMASDDPERAGQILSAGGVFGALGGVASRFTEAKQRRGEEATSDIARMLVDIQGGNELRSGLGGEIMRNRVRPGTRFQEGERGFVMPEQEVASFLTEMEMAGADVAAFVQGKSFDELAQWAAYQGFFRDKVDLVPLNATDYKLNAEANGQNGSGAYFLQPSEGRRARIFVNADSRRAGLAPHEYGHAVLRGGALSPDQIDAVHADISGRYTPDVLKGMAGEYAASMVRAENARAGIDIEPSPAAIEAKVNELSQGSMVKGSADGLDWLREEIFAEEFRNANIDFSRARRNIPLGANPVSFMENLLGAQSRALHMAGIDIDPQTGKPMGRDQIFKENRVAAGDPVVMKNYEAYVKQWRQWIKDPTHEADPGVAVSKTGNVQDTANNPNVTWRDYGGGRMENEFGVKNPDGTVTPKDWNRDIKPTVRARQQAVREMSNRSKQVASADDSTFGMRTRRDGRREISGRVLPDTFFFIPQYKPFHNDIRKVVAADRAGETLQVRYYAKGKSKDVFKDGVNGVNAVNREAMHGNFVAKKDGTLMWGYLDMTQFRNRAMKAIADRNPALEPYNWDLKTMMDDLPTHLSDQASGRGGAVSVGQERANVLNGLIGIGTGPLVGSFGRGTAYKTIHLDSIDAVVPTGKQGGQFDVYRANRNAMPDDPKPPVDMETDLTPDNNNRMPSALSQAGMAMPDVAVVPERFTGTGQEPNRQSRFAQPPPFFARFPIESYERGGKFFDAQSGEDLTGRSYGAGFIDVSSGKPRLFVDGDPAAQPAQSGRIYRTNLFKQKAGWKWTSDNTPATSTIVSVEGGGRHVYALRADFEGGVDLARYSDKPSEPRLRPTARGELSLGNEVGRISIRGKEHPVYDGARIAQQDAPRGQAMPDGSQPVRGQAMADVGSAADETPRRLIDMPQSALKVLHANSAELPKPAKKLTNATVALTLADVAERHNNGIITSSNITPEQKSDLMILGADEAEAALKASGKNAGNWYSVAIEAALGIAGVIYRELSDAVAARSHAVLAKETDPVKAGQFALRLPLAITSQNMTVKLNTRASNEQFNIFLKTGKFDPSIAYGEKAKSISGNLDLANVMINELGSVLALEDFVSRTFTVRELEAEASSIAGRKITIAGRKDDIVNGAAIFGPKIGQGFLQNLMGKFDPVTIDLWMRRTWGRWTGDVVGDGVTAQRLARLVDQSRKSGRKLPDSIKRLRTTMRSMGETKTGKAKKPELTMSEDVEARLEAEAPFRKEVEAFAKEVNAEFQGLYKLMSDVMSPALAKKVQDAIERADRLPDQADAILSDVYNAVVREQSRVKQQLDKKWSGLSLDEKREMAARRLPGWADVKPQDRAKFIKKSKLILKGDWLEMQHQAEGRTAKLDNPQKNVIKPAWANAAKSIVSELNPIDIPSDMDRRVITEVVNGIREELERRGHTVTNADVQAILWYPEKDLWAKLRGEEESILKQSYDDEFINIAEGLGLGLEARKVAKQIRGY